VSEPNPGQKASPYADRCNDFLVDLSRLTTGHVRTAVVARVARADFLAARAARLCDDFVTPGGGTGLAWPS